jgi:hypothetical protein
VPTTPLISIKKLSLDTHNYRTVVQPDEISAIHSLIDVEPEWFWAVMESLLDDGYLPNENIIALQEGKKNIVKEGNRRIAAMKIIHGFVSAGEFSLPPHISEKLAALDSTWKKANADVPCANYAASEAAAADRVVTLTHGKGEKAGRLRWSAVARARHSRDKSNASEPALDLLEKYLDKGKNLSVTQAARWAGEYPLTVLEDAMKRLAIRLELKSGSEIAKVYPKINNRSGFEELMLDIGLGNIRFKDVRTESFGDKYGIFAPQTQDQQTSHTGQESTSSATGSEAGSSTTSGVNVQTTSTSNPSGATSSTTPASGTTSSTSSTTKGSNAHSTNDPRSVASLLRNFKPKGNKRAKLVTLLNEIKKLDVMETPHAFCFVLRSMFEVSAKAYCADHSSNGGPKTVEANGNDRALVNVLKDVVGHLTYNKQNKAMTRTLHGAITELANSESVLSVTSMNQLVHNTSYVVNGTNICTLFANVFPLLEEMNK